jgi:hypothetical protein
MNWPRLALAALALTCPLSVKAQVQSASPPSIEVKISGPRLIRRGDVLKFHVTFTNRTDGPLALRLPHWWEQSTKLSWRITDTGGRLLPPHTYAEPQLAFCPIDSPISDWDIEVLAPHETRDYSYLAGDPSDYFSFPKKGFYLISLSYILDPTTPVTKAPYEVPSNPPEPYTGDQKRDMFKRTPRIEATSNEWQVYFLE